MRERWSSSSAPSGAVRQGSRRACGARRSSAGVMSRSSARASSPRGTSEPASCSPSGVSSTSSTRSAPESSVASSIRNSCSSAALRSSFRRSPVSTSRSNGSRRFASPARWAARRSGDRRRLRASLSHAPTISRCAVDLVQVVAAQAFVAQAGDALQHELDTPSRAPRAPPALCLLACSAWLCRHHVSARRHAVERRQVMRAVQFGGAPRGGQCGARLSQRQTGLPDRTSARRFPARQDRCRARASAARSKWRSAVRRIALEQGEPALGAERRRRAATALASASRLRRPLRRCRRGRCPGAPSRAPPRPATVKLLSRLARAPMRR